MDRRQAITNLNLYIRLLSVLVLEKDYLNFRTPEIREVEVYVSPRALPDMLTDGTGPVTIKQFLRATCDFELYDIMEELEMNLAPIVAFFRDDQLAEAYERLINLRTLLEEDFDESDTIILSDAEEEDEKEF